MYHMAVGIAFTVCKIICTVAFFSERELAFMFAICHRPSVCQSVVCLSSVTFMHPTQVIEIFGNVSMPFGTLAVCDPSIKISWRSSQGKPFVWG